jgi:hypothetical protein
LRARGIGIGIIRTDTACKAYVKIKCGGEYNRWKDVSEPYIGDLLDDKPENPVVLLKELLDSALYKAKYDGRNQVSAWGYR